MQNVIVYNKNWEMAGYIDAYISLIWTKRYTSPGDFELYLAYSRHLVDILKVGSFVTLENAVDRGGIYAMIIERVEITQSHSDGATILVKGRSLLSLLYRRVLYNELIESASCFEFISDLINNCFGGLTVPPRRWLTYDGNAAYYLNDLTGDTDKRVRVAGKGDNLGEVISQFCEEKGIGIDILYLPNSSMYSIYVYKFDSKADEIIFSSDLDNLAECEYVQDISDYANVALISSNESYMTAPNGIDSTKKPEFMGIERFEQSFKTDFANNSGITSSSALQVSGVRQLRKKQNTQEITADIISDTAYRYETDYYVGDVVTIKTDFGITATAQIVEMTESWSMDEHTMIPTFSNYIIMQEEV